MVWLRALWALSGAWLLFGVATVSAQPVDAIAQAHVEAGASDFEMRDYAGALREFERAYELSPSAALLYDLYAAHERLGHVAEAAKYLDAYLRSAEEVEHRKALETRLANLKHLLELGHATEPAAEQPLPAPLLHRDTHLHRDAQGTRASERGAPEVSERLVQALAFFTVAGAGGVTFAVAGGLALKEDKALAGSCGSDAGRTCSDDDVSGLRRRSMVADIGLGLLTVGSLVGVTLLWVDRRERSRRAATLRPVATFDAHGGSFALGGRF